MSIADLRREYNLTGLRRKDLEADPIRQFQRWFDQVQGARASGQMRKFFVRLYKRLLLMGGDKSKGAHANADDFPCVRLHLW